MVIFDTSSTDFSAPEGLENLYSLSYLWYSFLALLIVVTVGLAVSFVTGKAVVTVHWGSGVVVRPAAGVAGAWRLVWLLIWCDKNYNSAFAHYRIPLS